MKNTYLPFKIGDQYENWEFDLEYCKEERIKGCDSYLYNKTINYFNKNPYSIKLTFSLDILVLVEMLFIFNTDSELVEFRDRLSRDIQKSNSSENLKILKFTVQIFNYYKPSLNIKYSK